MVVFSFSASFPAAGELVMSIELLLACELRERLCAILGGEVDADPSVGNDNFPLPTTNYVAHARNFFYFLFRNPLLFEDDCEEYKIQVTRCVVVTSSTNEIKDLLGQRIASEKGSGSLLK